MQQQQPRSPANSGAPDAPRFPFPSLPKGWFMVALSEEVPADEIVPLHYFGRDLVAFRGESGKVSVVDAYCPHLGANFNHGGKIEGDCIRCPYHGWRFDGAGECVEVPYSERIPPKAKLEAFEVREQDGCVFVFYSPEPLAPDEPWELPPVEAIQGMTPGKVVHWKALRTHPQEVFENTVDIAHINPVHDGRDARVLGEPLREGPKMTIELEFTAPGDVVDMPGTYNDVHLHVTMHGLGAVIVQTHVRNVDVRACQRIYATPVDAETIDMRGIVHVAFKDDAEFTAELAEIFYRAYVEDFARDFPIWENKRYLVRPSLAKGDGPIGLYRKWCTQFYVEPGQQPGQAAEQRAGHARTTAPPESGAQPPLTPARALLRRIQPVRDLVRESAGDLVSRTRGVAPWLADLVEPLGLVPTQADSGPHAGGEGEDEGWSPSAAPARAAKPKASRAEPTLRVADVDDYIATLPQRFVPSAAKGVDAVFQWQLAGVGGRTFHVVVRGGGMEIVEGAHAKPTTTLVIGAEDYVRVVNGELDGMRVFTSGKGKVKGSIKAAMQMRTLFPA